MSAGAGANKVLTTNASGIASWQTAAGGWDGILPNYTTAQRNALSLADGLIVYNTTDKAVQIYKSGVWANVSAKLSLAAVCSLDGDCDSTHCVDGVCCLISCLGGCEACNLAGTIGTCTKRAANDITESPPACQRCDGVNTTFQPQTATDGYLCTGNCTRCVSGSCNNYSDGTACETGDICKACSSGSCSSVAAGTSGYGCTATHFGCDGAGNCTAPCSSATQCQRPGSAISCTAQCALTGMCSCVSWNSSRFCNETIGPCSNLYNGSSGCLCYFWLY